MISLTLNETKPSYNNKKDGLGAKVAYRVKCVHPYLMYEQSCIKSVDIYQVTSKGETLQ